MSDSDLIAMIYEAFSDLSLDSYAPPSQVLSLIFDFIEQFCNEPTVKEKHSKKVNESYWKILSQEL